MNRYVCVLCGAHAYSSTMEKGKIFDCIREGCIGKAILNNEVPYAEKDLKWVHANPALCAVHHNDEDNLFVSDEFPRLNLAKNFTVTDILDCSRKMVKG